MIKENIQLFVYKKKWRKNNNHNRTRVLNIFKQECVTVGRYTYGGIKVISHNDGSCLRIGDFCSIAPNVTFLLNSEHNLSYISTFPFKSNFLGMQEAESKGDIIIDDDVWIGYNSVIMSGVHIGQGAVIAAGAVVTKDVLPYSIVGGNPAKIIKFRFGEQIIQELLRIDYSKLDEKMIKEHMDNLYCPLIKREQLDWLRLS